MPSIKTHFTFKDTPRLKAKGWEKVLPANGDQKKTGMVLLTSDKINFK